MARDKGAVDTAARILRHSVGVDSQHDELAGRRGGIDERGRVSPGSTKDRLHAVETARTRSLVAQREIGPRGEGCGADSKSGGRIILPIDEVDRLEVRPVFSRRLQADALQFAGDVLDALDVAGAG